MSDPADLPGSGEPGSGREGPATRLPGSPAPHPGLEGTQRGRRRDPVKHGWAPWAALRPSPAGARLPRLRPGGQAGSFAVTGLQV